jgi:hypothetical protein
MPILFTCASTSLSALGSTSLPALVSSMSSSLYIRETAGAAVADDGGEADAGPVLPRPARRQTDK